MGQAAGAAVGPGVSMLDIAACAGEQTRAIARCVGPGARVLTTDISSRILGQAADKLRRAGFAAVQTQVADAQALGLAGTGYDAAVSRLGLMFCPAPLQALAGIRAALKPSGRFAALVFAVPPGKPCMATLMATARRHRGLGPASPFEPGPARAAC